MSHIISPFRRVEVREHEYHFDSIIHPGSGYCFDADAEGNIVIDPHYHECQTASLDNARAQVAAGTMRERGYVTYTRSYNENALLRCDCRATVELWTHTNECERCHRLYNLSGQSLAPMSQWEPEDVADLFGVGNDDY